MFEGLLVDLVPYGERFMAREHDWFNGPGVYFWTMGGLWFVTQAGITAHQQERAEDRERGDMRMTFGIQAKDGSPIGRIGVTQLLAHHRLAMLTALIGEPEYWGGGYGTDALLLLIDYLFDWLDLRKVWLMTMTANARVVRQMEKVGFTLEARPREATWVDGAWVDALIYGLRREEWPGRAAVVSRLGLTAQKDE